jgi:hypothetical protein
MVNEIARKSGDPELIALAQEETGETIVADPQEEPPATGDDEDADGDAPADDANPEGDAAGDAPDAN